MGKSRALAAPEGEESAGEVAVISNKATDFIIYDAATRFPLFSSDDRMAMNAKLLALHSFDQANGVVRKFRCTQRTVTYEGDTVPKGVDGIGARGEVEENDLDLNA